MQTSEKKFAPEAGGTEEIDGAAGLRAHGLNEDQRKLVGLAVAFTVILLWVAYSFWYRQASGNAECAVQRKQLFVASQMIQSEYGREGMLELLDRGPSLLAERGLVARMPECPSGGTYQMRAEGPRGVPDVTCTRHGDGQ